VYSQKVLLALVEGGMSREDAYRVVQSAAHRALAGDGGFRGNLEADPAVMASISDQLSVLFDPQAFLLHMDVAFDRLNLGVKT